MIQIPYILYSNTKDEADAIIAGGSDANVKLSLVQRSLLKTVQFWNCNRYCFINCPNSMQIDTFLNYKHLDIPTGLKALKILNCNYDFENQELSINLPEDKHDLVVFHIENLSALGRITLTTVNLKAENGVIWIENCQITGEGVLSADNIYLKDVHFTDRVRIIGKSATPVLNNVTGVVDITTVF